MGEGAFGTPFPVGVDALDIPEVRRTLKGIIGHTQLFSLIDVRGALLHMQAGGQHLGGSFPELRAVVAEA